MHKLYESQLQQFDLLNVPGIYFFSREYNGFKFGYVGQSKHLYDRVVEHLHGYDQHIDLSLKKYGLYHSEYNPNGYKVTALAYCTEEELDELELTYCREKANEGYQLRNVTSGSQGTGKFNLHENQQRSKTYRDGVKKGSEDVKKYLRNLLLDKRYIKITVQEPSNKYKEKALSKLYEFLEINTSTVDK